MKSIKSDFERMVKRYPIHSSFICFGRAVWGKKYAHEIIRRNFNSLIDHGDYQPKDKFVLFKHFDYLTNLPEETGF